jgi:hypothetical protein
LPHALIEYVESVGGPQGMLTIGTKDLQSYALSFRHSSVSLEKAHEFIRDKAMTNLYMQPFAFKYRFKSKNVEGWQIYDPISEYVRIGLPDKYYAVTRINEEYKACETYPFVSSDRMCQS